MSVGRVISGLGVMFGQRAASGYTFLHSGRPLPAEGDAAVRKEGVGILLDERATAAWRQAGEVWQAVSSRIVVARLKWVGRGQRRVGGSRETSDLYVSVVCVYAVGSATFV